MSSSENKTNSTLKANLDELEWLRYKEVEQEENSIKSNLLRNPIIPIGMLATTVALGLGLKSLYTGNRNFSQKMMRARVGAQGFTIVALVGGLFYHATNS